LVVDLLSYFAKPSAGSLGERLKSQQSGKGWKMSENTSSLISLYSGQKKRHHSSQRRERNQEKKLLG